MACNENVIKNMANEITRDCQANNVSVDPEFVIYLIDLFLLNPKYGKLFAKTINRNNLAYFVDECVGMLTSDGTALNTLKMQFILQTNYDKLEILIEKHLDHINKCLAPLVDEILDMDPDPNNEAEYHKLFRKMSIYFVLASGLGNPSYIVTLKEGMAALESVFGMEDLKAFVALPRSDKSVQLEVLLGYTSGVRLFNRDCGKGGEGIPDLPLNLVDAGKACMSLLSNSLITVMQRVNKLTTAIEDAIAIQEETGNIIVDLTMDDHSELTKEDYKEVFELLAFNRQYEVFIRKLLADVEYMTHKGSTYVERTKAVLQELHAAVKYKAAVPVQNVFPLFTKLWEVWRAMQNVMYLVSTVNRLMGIMGDIQDKIKMPVKVVSKMLQGKTVNTDHCRLNNPPSTGDRLSLASLHNYVSYSSSSELSGTKQAEFLGFCALCLVVGALVPSNVKIGLIKSKGGYYGFCSVKMASRFSKDPERYINEVLHYARNNPHLINLLNIVENVFNVKDIVDLVVLRVPKIKVFEKDIQTELHPVPTYKDKHYSWDLWEWKRRACQWATIVNCKTHSTQTKYSHLRSDIQCQTVEPRDKSLQTHKDTGMNTVNSQYFIWGLRGQRGYGQHVMELKVQHSMEALKPKTVTTCTWPCLNPAEDSVVESVSEEKTFYFPDEYEESD
ncbi:cilia- and flagella-associated protein 206-like [Spodoptera frugiperda]|uniref:Cilia- and flagella-associated protein 206 n=1 Tax=Spodoptera frugiperda TaxID=7108 RepID=A0A9R0D671_SPOFR|nr:cilia- and flagella-associated protein 206-like [Spodoptera frugiperda]